MAVKNLCAKTVKSDQAYEVWQVKEHPWLDEWKLRPGLPWQPLLEEQIGKIKSAAVFVGKNGRGP